MKVCGFSFIRNAIKYKYPVVESIQSVLPVCDKFIVSVGNSEDGTLELIRGIKSGKIEIFESIWDDTLRKKGEVLSVETNKVFDIVPDEYDWAFYIQADEVIHEKYHENIRQSMAKWKKSEEVEGLLFNYLHFYGSYDFVGDSRRWYRNEVRIIRNNKKIRSYKDAQGFRINKRKLQVKPVNAHVYHYGWVNPPEVLKEKIMSFLTFWFSDDWIRKNMSTNKKFDYKEIDSLKRFEGTHPEVMHKFVDEMNWSLDIDTAKKKFDFKNGILYRFEKITGIRPFEYKNYTLI